MWIIPGAIGLDNPHGARRQRQGEQESKAPESWRSGDQVHDRLLEQVYSDCAGAECSGDCPNSVLESRNGKKNFPRRNRCDGYQL